MTHPRRLRRLLAVVSGLALGLSLLAGIAAPAQAAGAVDARSQGDLPRTGPSTAPAAEDPAPWSATETYQPGDLVTHLGSLWRACGVQDPDDPEIGIEEPGTDVWGRWEELVESGTGVAAWTPSRIFEAGEVVLHQGVRYVALWWTRNQEPGDPHGPWEAQITPDWTPSKIYLAGAQVTYDGRLWEAGWWTRNQQPGDPHGPWQEMAMTADGTPVWTPSRIFEAGDLAAHRGTRYVTRWWTRNQEPGTDPDGPWVEARVAPPAAVRIKGQVKVGDRIRVAARWPSAARVSYRWYAGGKRIKGQSKRALRLTPTMRGKRIRIKVTGRGPGFKARTVTVRTKRVRG